MSVSRPQSSTIAADVRALSSLQQDTITRSSLKLRHIGLGGSDSSASLSSSSSSAEGSLEAAAERRLLHLVRGRALELLRSHKTHSVSSTKAAASLFQRAAPGDDPRAPADLMASMGKGVGDWVAEVSKINAVSERFEKTCSSLGNSVESLSETKKGDLTATAASSSSPSSAAAKATLDAYNSAMLTSQRTDRHWWLLYSQDHLTAWLQGKGRTAGASAAPTSKLAAEPGCLAPGVVDIRTTHQAWPFQLGSGGAVDGSGTVSSALALPREKGEAGFSSVTQRGTLANRPASLDNIAASAAAAAAAAKMGATASKGAKPLTIKRSLSVRGAPSVFETLRESPLIKGAGGVGSGASINNADDEEDAAPTSGAAKDGNGNVSELGLPLFKQLSPESLSLNSIPDQDASDWWLQSVRTPPARTTLSVQLTQANMRDLDNAGNTQHQKQQQQQQFPLSLGNSANSAATTASLQLMTTTAANLPTMNPSLAAKLSLASPPLTFNEAARKLGVIDPWDIDGASMAFAFPGPQTTNAAKSARNPHSQHHLRLPNETTAGFFAREHERLKREAREAEQGSMEAAEAAAEAARAALNSAPGASGKASKTASGLQSKGSSSRAASPMQTAKRREEVSLSLDQMGPPLLSVEDQLATAFSKFSSSSGNGNGESASASASDPSSSPTASHSRLSSAPIMPAPAPKQSISSLAKEAYLNALRERKFSMQDDAFFITGALVANVLKNAPASSSSSAQVMDAVKAAAAAGFFGLGEGGGEGQRNPLKKFPPPSSSSSSSSSLSSAVGSIGGGKAIEDLVEMALLVRHVSARRIQRCWRRCRAYAIASAELARLRDAKRAAAFQKLSTVQGALINFCKMIETSVGVEILGGGGQEGMGFSGQLGQQRSMLAGTTTASATFTPQTLTASRRSQGRGGGLRDASSSIGTSSLHQNTNSRSPSSFPSSTTFNHPPPAAEETVGHMLANALTLVSRRVSEAGDAVLRGEPLPSSSSFMGIASSGAMPLQRRGAVEERQKGEGRDEYSSPSAPSGQEEKFQKTLNAAASIVGAGGGRPSTQQQTTIQRGALSDAGRENVGREPTFDSMNDFSVYNRPPQSMQGEGMAPVASSLHQLPIFSTSPMSIAQSFDSAVLQGAVGGGRLSSTSNSSSASSSSSGLPSSSKLSSSSSSLQRSGVHGGTVHPIPFGLSLMPPNSFRHSSSLAASVSSMSASLPTGGAGSLPTVRLSGSRDVGGGGKPDGKTIQAKPLIVFPPQDDPAYQQQQSSSNSSSSSIQQSGSGSSTNAAFAGPTEASVAAVTARPTHTAALSSLSPPSSSSPSFLLHDSAAGEGTGSSLGTFGSATLRAGLATSTVNFGGTMSGPSPAPGEGAGAGSESKVSKRYASS